jgi:O-antigen/teichoic acid export membrane protein
LKQIVRSTFFITAGGALPLLSSLVLLIPYTNNLSTANYGALAIYISFALLVQILMNYAVDAYLSVHYYDYQENENKLKHFLSNVFGILLSIGGVFILVISFIGYLIFPIIFKENEISFFPYGLMSVVTAFFNAWFRTYVNIQVFGERPVKYFLFGLFNFLVTVVISIYLINLYPYTLIGPMWGRLLSGVFIFILTFSFGLKEFGLKFDYKLLPSIRAYATPVLIFSLLTWVLAYINNYILSGIMTVGDVGVYDFALKCTLGIEYAGLGIAGAFNPRIYKNWKSKGELLNGSQEENRYYHVFSAVNMLIISTTIFIVPFLIRLFVNNEQYYESLDFLPLLCAAFVFKSLHTIYLNPIMYFKRTNLLPMILVITALVQIISGILLINLFGIWGAVWSYFLVKPIQVLLLRHKAKAFFNFSFNKLKIFWVPMSYVLGVIVLCSTNLSEFEINTSQLVFAILLILFAYKNEIKVLPSMFKKAP